MVAQLVAFEHHVHEGLRAPMKHSARTGEGGLCRAIEQGHHLRSAEGVTDMSEC